MVASVRGPAERAAAAVSLRVQNGCPAAQRLAQRHGLALFRARNEQLYTTSDALLQVRRRR